MKTGIYITLILGIGLQLFYYSVSPDNLANHFGAGGIPNGWMSSSGHLLVGLITLLVNSLIFLALPKLLGKTPIRYISFPAKAYWLAPERRENSLIIISKWLLFIGLMTNLLLLSVFHLVFMANQTQPPQLDETAFLVILSAYLIVVSVWLTALFKKFGKHGQQGSL